MEIEEGVIPFTFTCCQYVFCSNLNLRSVYLSLPRIFFVITWVYIKNSGCIINYFYTRSVTVLLFLFLTLLRPGWDFSSLSF